LTVKPVLFHAEAQAEFFAAQDYYEQQVAGLGEDFRGEVQAALAVIRGAPQRWPVREAGTQAYLVHRFPFAVIYLNLPARIWIVAVAHTSRRPGYWQNRLA
jgi:toxin ParE1/3/4